MTGVEIKAALAFIIVLFGISVPLPDFLAGLVVAMGCCYGIMIVSDPQDRMTLWATLFIGFIAACFAAMLYPHIGAINWLPLQAIMGIAGALSRFLARSIISFGRALVNRAEEIPGQIKLPWGDDK